MARHVDTLNSTLSRSLSSASCWPGRRRRRRRRENRSRKGIDTRDTAVTTQLHLDCNHHRIQGSHLLVVAAFSTGAEQHLERGIERGCEERETDGCVQSTQAT
jgi:hypothetical protein